LAEVTDECGQNRPGKFVGHISHFLLRLTPVADYSIDNSWSLDIQPVPEPVTTSLIILGAIFGCYQLVRYLRFGKTRLA